MSYDVRVYSVKAFDPASFDGDKDWNSAQSSFQSAKWQIVVNPSDKILPEDIEDEVAALLPGIGYLTEMNLEGASTDKAMRRLRGAAKLIAKTTHGIIEDPQKDTIETPAGVSRFSTPPKQATFSVICLSWWYLGDGLLDRAKRESFLSLLERELPEALPKRYGLWEPPQHRYAETGREHLHQFLEENLHSPVVWYPHRPVATMNVVCPKPLGPGPRGFRSNLVEIEVESAALQQPGWETSLPRFWRAMSALLQPIYGDVRTIGGYSRGGATVYVSATDVGRDDDLNRSSFFRGIPKRLGQAVVLGEEYQRLWPSFVEKSEIESGLAFASLPDWSTEKDLSDQAGSTPEGLALLPMPKMGQKQDYPQVWPFGPTS